MKSFKQHIDEAKTFTLVAKKGSKKIETVNKVTQKELKTVEMLLKTAHGKDIKVEKIKESVELDEKMQFVAKKGDYALVLVKMGKILNMGTKKKMDKQFSDMQKEYSGLDLSKKYKVVPVKQGTKLADKIKESVELDEANDPHAVNELYLYIINNGDIHRKRIQPIIKNYRKKVAKGGFDEKLAVKGFLQAVNDGIKAYGKEFDTVKVSKPDRELIAKKLLHYYRDEINEDVDLEEKNTPTNPALWAKAKSAARSKFDVYPSAYANAWASKWYKSKGGGWKKS